MSLTDIYPTRLTRARETVVVEHPGTAIPPAPPEGLRQRVAAAAGDVQRLESLGRELSPRQVRSLVSGLENWEGLRPAVRLLLSRRMRADLLAPLWLAWQNHPASEDVRRVLMECVERFGWQTVLPDQLHRAAGEWIGSDQPHIAIQAWLAESGRSYSLLATEAILASGTELRLMIRNAVMTRGSAFQLRTEGASQLLAWASEPDLDSDTASKFGSNYLSQLPADEWDLPLLHWIEQRVGLPKKPKKNQAGEDQAEFWKPIPEHAKASFQKIIIDGKVEKAVEDKERAAYWGRWAEHMHDVETGTAGDVPYSVFDFGGFGVIEFFVTGNAAYIYTPAELAKLKRRWARRPDDLKIKHENVAFTPGQDNRIVHMGSWQSKASLKVRAWLRQTST